MARPLFEQYKDALRRGHVAALGGELEDALAAYMEAAGLVPDRPLPYASMGTVLARLGRGQEALAAFDRALAIAPDDDATLQARAALLDEMGHPAGVLAEPEPSAEPEVVAEAPPAPAEAPQEPAAGPGGGWPAVDLPSAPEAPLVGPPPDPAVLQAEAEAEIEAGDPGAARDRLLLAMAVHRDAGRLDAALDACLQVLAIAPGDPRVHLAIANLQLDRGWRAVATEKIELLLRLTSLSGDAQAEADVHLLAADRLRDESPARLDARRRGAATA
jgi:tetratricopeptide (TPR) repeat protein